MPPAASDQGDAASDLAVLSAAAREAGVIARSFWRKAPRAWDKADGAGPVTEADLAVDRHLHAMLTAARPDYGWLSEESADHPARLDARRVFIVDPIDGTRAFIDGQAGFSHALAVVEGDRVIAGVVYLPIKDCLYGAHHDGPALCNDQVIRPAAKTLIDGATVLTQRASLDPGHWRNGMVPPLRREFRPSLAWRFCLVAEGRFDATLSMRGAWEWDIAAGALIAQRAGCTVTDRRGRPMRFNNPVPLVDGLLVAGPALHAAVLAQTAGRTGR